MKRWGKKILCFVLCTILIMQGSDFGQMVQSTDIVFIKIGSNIAIIGEKIQYISNENRDAVPYVEKNTTFVPLRFFAEVFNARVAWDQKNKQITLGFADETMILDVQNNQYFMNEKWHSIVPRCKITDGTTYVPMRMLCENVLKKQVLYQNGYIMVYDSGFKDDLNNKFTELKTKLDDAISPLLVYAMEQEHDENDSDIPYKYGYVNMRGEIVIEAIYDEVISPILEDYVGASYVKDGKKTNGILSKDGAFSPTEKYHIYAPFVNGWAVAESKSDRSLQNLINGEGETLFKNDFDFDGNSEEGLLKNVTLLENNYFLVKYINKNQDVVVTLPEAHYPHFAHWSEGMLRILNEKTHKYGFINRNGEVVVPCIYDGAQPYRNGITVAEIHDEEHGNKEFYIDKSGKVVREITNVFLPRPNQKKGEVEPIRINKKYVYLDYEGRPINNETYPDANIFSEGLAACLSAGGYGFINLTGEEVIKHQYKRVYYDFYKGVSLVTDGNNLIWINSSGDEIRKFKFGKHPYSVWHLFGPALNWDCL